ncbi:hypothetical protein LJC49_11065, partial [Ruminococcaceae bacterium OttesenSCG-928-I18]|nr:hypothetical protein [Ruminococcaceae bacterium OttesenSCG-928-I18]
AILSAVGGVMMSLGLGQADFLRAAAFVMAGAMLLFLALAESGQENAGKRARLLGLFFLLLVSYFDLPLLCPVLEALVVPLLLVLYRRQGDGGRIALVGFFELTYALCRTLALAALFGAYTLQVVGMAMLAVAAARFWALLRLYRRA